MPLTPHQTRRRRWPRLRRIGNHIAGEFKDWLAERACHRVERKLLWAHRTLYYIGRHAFVNNDGWDVISEPWADALSSIDLVLSHYDGRMSRTAAAIKTCSITDDDIIL